MSGQAVHRKIKTVNRQLTTVSPALPTGRRKFKGFTLIELLVVITIISILLAMGTYSYTNAQRKGRDGKRKADMKTVQQALELYYQDNGAYPAAGGTGKINCEQGGASVELTWGTSAFSCDDPVSGSSISYLEKLPKDPKGTNEYFYSAPATPVNYYVISAVLENTADQDYTTSGCVPSYTYCVRNP